MAEDLLALYKAHVEHLTRKTTEALAAEGFDALVIHSGLLRKRSEFDDVYWPLRTVPHFQHWAHLEWPDCAIHLRTGARPVLLYVRDRSFWERPPEPRWGELGAVFDLVEAENAFKLGLALSPRAKTAFIGESAMRAAEWGILSENVNPKGLLQRMDELRVFKTAYEIACIQEANRIASSGHREVRDAFAGGLRSELELHLLYLKATNQDDPETPYKNIVALGETASILHHVHYRRSPIEAGSLLLDAGATFKGYASDVTRTYAAKGSSDASMAFAALVERMEWLQQAVCRSIAVGRPYESLHDEAHDRLARVLVESGIAKMSAEECVTTGVTRKFLPHGLGHSLGLQTHDVGCAKVRPREDNPFLRNTRVIEPRQVFTIEPGLYFIDTFMEELRASPQSGRIDWRTVEALKPFGGIRIEDDLLVLEARAGGAPAENLTRESRIDA
jgi:Xaa-Pro dipeptidase